MQAIDKAKTAIGRGDVHAAVGGLLADLGGNNTPCTTPS